MTESPYNLMQAAVDIVGESEHPKNKIAATLAGTTRDGKPFHVSAVNGWPAAIKEKIGTDTKIGNSSGTVHAETACIIKAPMTDGSSLFVTDLLCPNCVKNIAESGVKNLYIDHKGFDKDWAARNGDHFAHMSMRICEHAGINVYKIHRKEERLEPILEIPADYVPHIEKPVKIQERPKDWTASLSLAKTESNEEPFAFAFVQDDKGQSKSLYAEAHPSVGYTSQTLEEPEGKYSFFLEPVNRLIMEASHLGLKIDPDHLYASRVPTSRELVNMVGAGLTRIQIGHLSDCRDEWCLKALERLASTGVLNVEQ